MYWLLFIIIINGTTFWPNLVRIEQKVTEIHVLVCADLPQNWTRKIFNQNLTTGMLNSKLSLVVNAAE